MLKTSISERNVPLSGFSLENGKKRDSSESATGSSAERSLRLLAFLAEQGRPLSLAELAEALALPKATAHRLCTQLLESGFIARGVEEREFAVGPALRKLALDTLNHATVQGLRHKILADLVADVGETCNFTTLDGAEVLYLDRVEAPWPWRLTLDVGVHVPVHCTASGKLFLALMPKARREALIQRLKLPRLTVSTLTDAELLRKECRTIAQQGHAFDREEFIDGLVAVAVPVRDGTGEARAAIALHAPIARMSVQQAGERVPALHAAAKRIGEQL